MTTLPVDVFTHGVRLGGGMDECTLRVVAYLSRGRRVALHSYYAHDIASVAPRVDVDPVWAINRPHLARGLSYLLSAAVRARRGRGRSLTLATGATLFGADVNVCHFCHAGWRRAGLESGAYRRLYTRVNEVLERKAYRSAAFVVAVSDKIRLELVRLHGIGGDRVRVISHGVDSERFRPARRAERARFRAEVGVPKESFVVGAVGDFVREMKRLDDVAEATAGCGADARLLVCGRVSEAIRRRVEGRLGGRVHFVGIRNDVERFYAALDAFALLSAYDAFGLVALEAMASGLPVVATDEVGAAPIVEAGGGVVVPVGRPAAAAAVLGLWRRSPAIARARGAAARRTVGPMTWSACGRAYQRVLDEAADRRGAAA